MVIFYLCKCCLVELVCENLITMLSLPALWRETGKEVAELDTKPEFQPCPLVTYITLSAVHRRRLKSRLR